MTTRKPLVQISGTIQELASGDSLAGLAVGADVQAYDADLTSIAGLTGTTGLLKKTAANTWSLDTSGYAPATSGTSLLYGNGSGGFSNATVGTGLTFAGGTLSASSAGQSIQATASGSLSDGSKVIVNSDGTVSVVGTTVLATPTVGSTVAFNSTGTNYTSAVYDPINAKVVIAYSIDSSYYGYVVVGTVSGTSISFGTPVVFNSSTTVYISAVYDPINSKVVIAYRGTSNYGYAIVGTVSGTSISFGTPVTFISSTTAYISAVYDSTNSKVVIAYYGTSEYGYAIVGTVSGTSISFGSATTFNSTATTGIQAGYDSTNSKVVIAYGQGASAYGTAIVGTVSGASISFGTPVTFNSAYTGTYKSVAYSPVYNKTVIAYLNSFNNGIAIVGTVSGTSISFGTPATYAAGNSSSPNITYDPFAQQLMLAYELYNQSNVTICTISGTSISFSTPVVFLSGTPNQLSVAYDTNKLKMVIAYRAPTTGYGTTTIVSTVVSNLSATNFIGISNGAYTNGQTATVQIIGAVDDAQSGLTAAQAYYVQANGTISTTPDSPSVFAGTAISATKLIVKG